MTTFLSAILANLVCLAHPEVGTVNMHDLSHGNVYPLVSCPWGAAGWTVQTRPLSSGNWFYDYNEPRFYGLRETNQPSPWIGDCCPWTLLPIVGAAGTNDAARFSWYAHSRETLRPDRYRAYLADFDISIDLVPSMRGAALRVVFPETDTPGLVVNPLKGGEVRVGNDGRSVVGFASSGNVRLGHVKGLRRHFILLFDRPIVSFERLADGALAVRFAPVKRGECANVRIASSFVSAAQARRNLKESAKGFEVLAKETTDVWNALLGRIRIDTPDVKKREMFYTCLYRTMLFPRTFWDEDENGEPVHFGFASQRPEKGYYYGGTGFWDTFRALMPLVNFIAPEMSAKMMAGLACCWKENGWLPEWSAPGLANCMIGNNSASVVADAWLSGIRGDFDIHDLYDALVHGANAVHPTLSAVGRLGFREYNEKGFVPRDVGIRESAARTLEYAYDDWCIAELGQAIGRPKKEVELYRTRSKNWRNVFRPDLKIACGRNVDGSFNRDFNPFAWGGDFTEGNAIHYTWSVFHDVEGLAAAMGGKDAFERRIDEVFEMPPTADCSAYGRVIHELREMQIMQCGQYAHGNQPIQHLVYLYNWTDHSEKAGLKAHEVMEKFYRPTPDGYCGDEDNGQTSAWYVWSAMGLYPVCPASGFYAAGLPFCDEITIERPGGKKLFIRKHGTGTARAITLNGKAAKDGKIRVADLKDGGELLFDTELPNCALSVSLDGEWEFSRGGNGWRTVVVPHDWRDKSAWHLEG